MCTLEKHDNLFILTLTGPDEHRLSPSIIATILRHLATVKSEATRGSALITTADLSSKFFSNGFDLRWANSAATSSGRFERLHSMVEDFRPVMAALLSLPLPTVAAVTGHAAAAGFMLALGHDYVVMRRDKGVFYMSEVDIGITLPDYFMKVLLGKIGSPAARRDILLRGAKLKGDEGARIGFVDEVRDGGEETLKAAMETAMKLGKRKWDGEVYAEIRKSLYPEICRLLGLETRAVARL